MIALGILAALVAAGVLFQIVGTYFDARRYPAPGHIVEAGCARLHLHEEGAGSPVVVLEAGIAASSLSWSLVQPRVAAFTRVCSYDRAGLGWSERCSRPRTIEQIVSELGAALARARIPAPYILVGHSFGGLLVRAYAHLRPDDVSGLVLVDPVSLDFWANCESKEFQRLKTGARLSRRGALLARLGIVRLALILVSLGARQVPKLIARASAAKQGAKVMERLAGEIRKLPREVWPMIRAHWSHPKCFEAMASYLEILPECAGAALRMPIPAHIPLIVLSASDATGAELIERDEWTSHSTQARHIRLEQCGHWIQLEQPDAVVKAVAELVALPSRR